jgi:hypothetical protein
MKNDLGTLDFSTSSITKAKIHNAAKITAKIIQISIPAYSLASQSPEYNITCIRNP